MRFEAVLGMTNEGHVQDKNVDSEARDDRRAEEVFVSLLESVSKLIPGLDTTQDKMEATFSDRVIGILDKISDGLDWITKNARILVPIVGGITAEFIAWKTLKFSAGVISEINIISAALSKLIGRSKAATAAIEATNLAGKTTGGGGLLSGINKAGTGAGALVMLGKLAELVQEAPKHTGAKESHQFGRIPVSPPLFVGTEKAKEALVGLSEKTHDTGQKTADLGVAMQSLILNVETMAATAAAWPFKMMFGGGQVSPEQVEKIRKKSQSYTPSTQPTLPSSPTASDKVDLHNTLFSGGANRGVPFKKSPADAGASIPLGDGHALGGIFYHPHFARFAERGGEAVQPLARTAQSLALHSRVGNILGVGSGGGHNFSIHAPMTVNVAAGASSSEAVTALRNEWQRLLDELPRRMSKMIDDQRRTAFT